MASVVGHTLGALVAWELGRTAEHHAAPPPRAGRAWAGVVGLLPDLDVVPPLIWPSVRGFDHRGASHSLLGAALIALAAALVAAAFDRRTGTARYFRLLLLCALAHPLLDWLMGLGPPVALLWPFTSEGWLSPIQLVPTAYYPLTWGDFEEIIALHDTWIGLLLEIGSIGSLLAAVRAGPRLRWPLLTVSAGMFLLVWLLYSAGGPLSWSD